MSSADFLKMGFIKHKLQGRRPKRKPVLRKKENFRTILIVGSTDKTPLFQETSKHFPNAKLEVLYLRKEKEDTSKNGQYSLHKSDFNLTGKVKNEKLSGLINKTFDLIIDLSSDDELLRYTMQQIHYSFMVGRKTSKNIFMYDLIVNADDNEHQFIQNIAQQILLLTANETK